MHDSTNTIKKGWGVILRRLVGFGGCRDYRRNKKGVLSAIVDNGHAITQLKGLLVNTIKKDSNTIKKAIYGHNQKGTLKRLVNSAGLP